MHLQKIKTEYNCFEILQHAFNANISFVQECDSYKDAISKPMWCSFDNWPIYRPPKNGVLADLLCRAILCIHLSMQIAITISSLNNWSVIYKWTNMAIVLYWVFSQAMRKLCRLGEKGWLSIGQLTYDLTPIHFNKELLIIRI